MLSPLAALRHDGGDTAALAGFRVNPISGQLYGRAVAGAGFFPGMDRTLELVAKDRAGATAVVKQFSVFFRPKLQLDQLVNTVTSLTGISPQYTVGARVEGKMTSSLARFFPVRFSAHCAVPCGLCVYTALSMCRANWW